MQAILEELEEFQRRFNREIQTFINRMAELDKDIQQNAAVLKSSVPRNPTESLVTIKRLCEFYPGIKAGTIKGWLYQNAWNVEFYCVRKFGRRIFIDVNEFEKWMKEPKPLRKKFAHMGFDCTRPSHTEKILKTWE